jgi:hypothetical protein
MWTSTIICGQPIIPASTIVCKQPIISASIIINMWTDNNFSKYYELIIKICGQQVVDSIEIQDI